MRIHFNPFPIDVIERHLSGTRSKSGTYRPFMLKGPKSRTSPHFGLPGRGKVTPRAAGAQDILRAELETSPWVSVDDTGARQRGKIGFCTQIGNEWFTFLGTRVYFLIRTTGRQWRRGFIARDAGPWRVLLMLVIGQGILGGRRSRGESSRLPRKRVSRDDEPSQHGRGR